MPATCCFSYSADVPPSSGNRNAVQPNPRGLRRMVTTCCFSYTVDAPPAVRNGDAAQRSLPGLRRMPFTCFSY